MITNYDEEVSEGFRGVVWSFPFRVSLFLLLMGFLSEGNALPWEQAKEYADYIRKEGIQQFLHIYQRLEARCCDELKWGDEIEYQVVEVDPEKKTAKLCLRAPEILHELMKDEKSSQYDHIGIYQYRNLLCYQQKPQNMLETRIWLIHVGVASWCALHIC